MGLEKTKPEKFSPGLGTEAVWEYPRSHCLGFLDERFLVKFCSEAVADTRDRYRVLETSHSPGTGVCMWETRPQQQRRGAMRNPPHPTP